MNPTPHTSSRAAVTVATSPLLGGAPLGAIAPAHADVVVDCQGGSVTIDQSIEQVIVTGTATGHRGTVALGGGNSTVVAPSAGDVTVSEGNDAARFTGTVGRVELLAGNTSLKAGRTGDVLVRTSTASVRATRASSVTVRGANNSVRLTRLPRLTVVGPNNLVVVAQGRTVVSVKGANNRIRVNKRA